MSVVADRRRHRGLQAELLVEANSDESTRLRDAFAQAARVSAALGG